MPEVKPKRLHKIGHVADVLNVSPRTIRYYEELGLIQPQRTEKGTRFYTEDDIRRVRTALTLRDHGLTLEDVSGLSCARAKFDTGREASKEILQQLTSLQAAIAEKLASYQSLAQDVDRAILLIRQCAHCERPPTNKGCPNCPVAKHKNESEIARLIWEADQA
jgi:DNA-binding transcriptional MerR regulator